MWELRGQSNTKLRVRRTLRRRFKHHKRWRGSTVELVLGTLLARGQSELRKAIRSASSCGVKTTPKRPS